MAMREVLLQDLQSKQRALKDTIASLRPFSSNAASPSTLAGPAACDTKPDGGAEIRPPPTSRLRNATWRRGDSTVAVLQALLAEDPAAAFARADIDSEWYRAFGAEQEDLPRRHGLFEGNRVLLAS